LIPTIARRFISVATLTVIVGARLKQTIAANYARSLPTNSRDVAVVTSIANSQADFAIKIDVLARKKVDTRSIVLVEKRILLSVDDD